MGQHTREISIGAAFDGTNYLVGIQGDATAHYNITAQLVSTSGALVGSRISVGRTGGAPMVSFDGTNYLMVWEDDANYPNDYVYGQFISKAGALVGSPFPIRQAARTQDVNILFDGTNYLVVWEDAKNWNDIDSDGQCDPSGEGSCIDIYGRFVSPSGSLGTEFPISTEAETQKAAFLSFDGTNYLVIWESRRSGPELWDTKGRFISKTGILSDMLVISQTPSPSYNPLGIAFDGTNFLVAWNRDIGSGYPNPTIWDIYGRMVSPSGNFLGSEFSITTAPGDQFFPFVAFDGANYLVTWTDARNDTNDNGVCDVGEGTCSDIYGQFINKSGVLQGSEIVISNNAGNQFGALTFGGGKYLALINNIDTFDGAVGDVYGMFLGGYGSGTHNASGTYTWDSGTLTITTTSSNFTCDGLMVGPPEIIPGVTITTDTMIWPDGPTWTRSPAGDANDPVGVWTFTESYSGNSYTLTINSVGEFTLEGIIIQCGSEEGEENPRAWSNHWSSGIVPSGYYVPLSYKDPGQTATSVSVTGPGTGSPWSLTYDTNWGGWNSWILENTPFLGATYPTGLPYTYTFTITDGTGTWTAPSTVSCFQEEFATGLSPIGTVTTGTPTFSWTGVTGGQYRVELNDSNWNNIWSIDTYQGATDIAYTGPALTPGMTYNYNVVVNSSAACSNGESFAQASFTYQTAATPLYVVWTDDTYGNNEIFLKKSTDNGATWTFQRLTTNAGNSQFPVVAVSGNNVYAVWQDDTYGNNEIFLKKSTDNGATWTFQRLTTNAGSSGRPSLVLSGSNIYVVWQDDTYGNKEIFLKKSTDNGATWTFQRLTTNTGVSMNPSIVVNGNNVYAVWQDDTYGNNEIFLKKSTDNGATWTFQRLTTNTGASVNPSIVVNGNNVYAVWQDDTYGNNEIFLKKSTDNGATWTFQRLTTNAGSSGRPSMVLSGSNIYVVWQDDTYGNNEIFLKKSTDNGATWTFQRLTTNTGASVNPSIRVNGNNIYAVWQDDTYGNNEIFLKKSTDNGATWTFQRLTTNAGNSVTGSSVTEPE